jgi:cell wall-associated NlpC family hydrolase
VSENVCYFISEPELIKAKPSMIISEQTPGVSVIDFDIDHGKVRDIVTVHARASRWIAAPGAVVVIENTGPADGRWLVQDMTRSLFDADTTITMQRATQPLPEPAPTTKTVSTASASSKQAIASAALGGDVCSQVLQAAQALAAKRFPYVWDGGHKSAGTPDTGAPGPGYTGHTVGFDCSGSTGAVLAAVGLGFKNGDSVPDSGTMASSWGEAGEGQCLTVWANSVHVFMFIKGDHYGTGDAGNAGGFAHQPMRSTAGFTPRHWPGL